MAASNGLSMGDYAQGEPTLARASQETVILVKDSDDVAEMEVASDPRRLAFANLKVEVELAREHAHAGSGRFRRHDSPDPHSHASILGRLQQPGREVRIAGMEHDVGFSCNSQPHSPRVDGDTLSRCEAPERDRRERDQHAAVLADDAAQVARGRTVDHDRLIAHAAKDLQRLVGRRIRMAERGTRLEVV
jgi:hypothetical protein